EFDGLTLIETCEASAIHRRDVNRDILAAALWLDEAVTRGLDKPFHGTCRHLSCSSSIESQWAYSTRGKKRCGRSYLPRPGPLPIVSNGENANLPLSIGSRLTARCGGKR